MNAILPSLTALIGVVAGAILTTTLSARRSDDGKIWEFRRVAYGEILSNLTSLEWSLETAENWIKEDAERYFRDDASVRHSETMGTHLRSARAAYVNNYLVLSDEFIQMFERFLHIVEGDYSDMPALEEHRIFANAVRAARPNLLRQARSEMPLVKPKPLTWLVRHAMQTVTRQP